ncbi:hypothetical protein EYF80_044880 [Liparis tanakae]|uniref:Uncharacterized protein n=1 Tax=Liparis tanakae TaxID=230148 RepID=A0A4Z2FVN6_9TELE|nr:hypothetical protein EYF80_044880 [Liparis tanakae]
MFLRSLTNSPIIFLSSRGFSRSHWATWSLSRGLLSRPFSCRNWIPFLDFWLNCSVPGVGLVLLGAAVEHLGLAVGFGAVDHREQRLQRQQVGGVELPRHRERILRNTRRRRSPN